MMVSLHSGKKSKKPYDIQRADIYEPYLLEILKGGAAIPAPFGGLSHLLCRGTIENGALRLLLKKSDDTPVFECAVSRKSMYGPRLWEQLCEEAGADLKRPIAPWCGFIIHNQNSLSFSEEEMVNELVYGIACAWLQYRRPCIKKIKRLVKLRFWVKFTDMFGFYLVCFFVCAGDTMAVAM